MIPRNTAWLGVLFVLFAAVASGKEPKEATGKGGPEKNVGLHARTLGLTPLRGEIPSIERSSLRMRLITVEPGGHTALHVHKDRPGIVYVVSGAVYNHPKGEKPKKVRAGEVFSETQGYTHYIENRGEVSATLISADIVAGTKD
jgi:quercetin dioxygenase-like cupin family protein